MYSTTRHSTGSRDSIKLKASTDWYADKVVDLLRFANRFIILIADRRNSSRQAKLRKKCVRFLLLAGGYCSERMDNNNSDHTQIPTVVRILLQVRQFG